MCVKAFPLYFTTYRELSRDCISLQLLTAALKFVLVFQAATLLLLSHLRLFQSVFSTCQPLAAVAFNI